jgi:hypothetical protein
MTKSEALTAMQEVRALSNQSWIRAASREAVSDNPKCHFQNGTDVTLFKMQLAEQGLATVAGFDIKLAK